MTNSVLKCLGLEAVADAETIRAVYGEGTPASPEEHFKKWLLLLPDKIVEQIHSALDQKRPFLPPDITPELMAIKNSKLPSMRQMDILYRCIDFAHQAQDFKMAASLVYVVDRATYWANASKNLLQVVDIIKVADPNVAIAPQVQVRRARVLKDEGDLHGAMRVLDEILDKRQHQPGEWKYVDDDQYTTTKAEIIKIKGHILYNMGSLKDAVEPFLESIHLFSSLREKDDKGIASCLGLLTKCLGKLSLEEFSDIRKQFPADFKNNHPCYESYAQGMEAVKHIQSLRESLYSSRHLLDADTSLLKYAILTPSLSDQFKMFQTILNEMKTSIGSHKTVDVLRSSEQFFEFVRALFMISLMLAFSPLEHDRKVAAYLEQLSIELYLHLCITIKGRQVARLEFSASLVKCINASLTILNLPTLVEVVQTEEVQQKSDEMNQKEDSFASENLHSTETTEEKRCSPKSKCEASNRDSIEESAEAEFRRTVPAAAVQEDSVLSLLKGAGKPQHNTTGAVEIGDNDKTSSSRKSKTSRAWTYNFGHETRPGESLVNRKPAYRTFPLENRARPLDPKKQWQTYKHRCVGLPVDPNFFSSPVPTVETTCDKLSNDGGTPSGNEESNDGGTTSGNKLSNDEVPLVNLSLLKIQQTVENKTKEKITPSVTSSLVDRNASTALTTEESQASDRLLLHPHDLLNQPMRYRRDLQQVYEDVDITTLSPLVNLAETTVKDFLEMDLGQGTATGDPVQYMTMWQPPELERYEERKIYRAFLLNYNPITGVWTGQSTLAFLGDHLELSKNDQGNCRDVFHVQFLHQDEPRGRYVGKRYREERYQDPKMYMQDVVCQMMAGHYVTKFNEALQSYKRDIKVQFLPAAHLQLLSPNGHPVDFINVEPYLHGFFKKLTNNFTFASKNEREKELATALTHFSYCESKGTLMIVDIQGWLPKEDSGVIYLTDPQFHTSGMEKFSPYDHQQKGMAEFWKSVHPHCNDLCQAIGLQRLDL